MATTGSPNRTSESEDLVDPTPLLGNSGGSSEDISNNRRFLRRHSLRQAARLLREASSRRMMREPSMLVRETAAEQLEERQSDWAYSKPVVILDLVWNFAFVVVAATVLLLSRNESPNMPLRIWITGYAGQCILHVVCVVIEYRRRRRTRRGRYTTVYDGVGSGANLSPGSTSDSTQYVASNQLEEERIWSVAKHLESANTMFSFIWWIIGFYWISAGGQSLADDSPQLYWLSVIFLGFDVFFVVFCVALACIIGMAVCCCLPCIIGLLYAVADQEGASKEEIEQLSKFKFRIKDSNEKLAGDVQGSLGGTMVECGSDTSIERILSPEEAECCICLSAYDEGVELRQLPCSHHFHCCCVDKWLHINATCPLCKYNILKNIRGQEEA